jgi:RNA methyltransferase, TrmH family
MINTITSLQHPLIKHLVKLREKKRYRYQQKKFLVEGLKPLKEICSKASPLNLFVSEGLESPLYCENTFWVDERIMKKISDVETPEGFVAEFKMLPEPVFNDGDYILVIDKISDPGNLGTLLRTALALGWDGAYITDNSVDPYNTKVIRSARGAHFRLPFASGSVKDFLELAQEKQWLCLLANTSGQPAKTFSTRGGRALILSNESSGPSEELLSLCKQTTIPMAGDMESLNVAVAGAILMYEIKHRLADV